MILSTFILLLTSIIAACTTYFMNEKLQQGPVRSSALLTLLVAGFFQLFPTLLSPYLTQNIPVVFIGSSFIGMVSAQQINNYLGIAVAGIIFCEIYLNTSLFFNGYGGALGTSACISILVVLAIPYFKSKRKLTVGFLQLRRLVLKRKR